jgi:hypothetical protein
MEEGRPGSSMQADFFVLVCPLTPESHTALLARYLRAIQGVLPSLMLVVMLT